MSSLVNLWKQLGRVVVTMKIQGFKVYHCALHSATVHSYASKNKLSSHFSVHPRDQGWIEDFWYSSTVNGSIRCSISVPRACTMYHTLAEIEKKNAIKGSVVGYVGKNWYVFGTGRLRLPVPIIINHDNQINYDAFYSHILSLWLTMMGHVLPWTAFL